VNVKVLPLSEVKTKLSELVDVVARRDESITITRNGKPVAMIVSKNEYDGWHETSEILRDPEFLSEIRDGIRSLARTRKRYTVDDLLGK
jgi:prevent-host-death family protein